MSAEWNERWVDPDSAEAGFEAGGVDATTSELERRFYGLVNLAVISSVLYIFYCCVAYLVLARYRSVRPEDDQDGSILESDSGNGDIRGGDHADSIDAEEGAIVRAAEEEVLNASTDGGRLSRTASARKRRQRTRSRASSVVGDGDRGRRRIVDAAAAVLAGELGGAESDVGPGADGDSVPFWICVLAAGAGLHTLLMLPFTILSNELIGAFGDSWYLHWLTSDLVFGLWNVGFVATNVGLFLAMPFAYFFFEADGLGRRGSLSAKIYETFVVVGLVALLSGGYFYLVQKMVVVETGRLPEFVNTLMSSVGALLFLLSTASGFYVLLKQSLDLFMPFNAEARITERLDILQVEHTDVSLRIARLSPGPSTPANGGGPSSSPPPPPPRAWRVGDAEDADRIATLGVLLDRRRAIRTERDQLQAQLDRSVVGQNLKFLIATLASAACCVAIVANVALYLPFDVVNPARLDVDTYYELGVRRLRTGFLGAAIEIALVAFLLMAAVMGLPRMPILRHLKPVKRQTTMRVLIGNVTLVLVLASALPAVARLMHITSFNLMGYYTSSAFLQNRWLVLTYDAVFLASTVPVIVRLALRLWGRYRANGPTVSTAPSADRASAAVDLAAGGGGDKPQPVGPTGGLSKKRDAAADLPGGRGMSGVGEAVLGREEAAEGARRTPWSKRAGVADGRPELMSE